MKFVISLTSLFLTLASSKWVGDQQKPQEVVEGSGSVELQHVIVMFRHGDRTPVKPYPQDPYKDESDWPVDFGMLTPRGMRMQYNLGQYLRQTYGHLIGDNYSEKNIYIRSTDVDRTLMSAQSNLAGLFPPTNGQLWNPELHWQPIPVHTVPVELDNLLTTKTDCPRMKEAVNEVLASQQVKEINDKYDWMYKYVSEHTGEKVEDMVVTGYVYDTLFIEELYNKTLPEWTKKVYPEPMKYVRDLSFKLSTWTHELKRLTAGVLIESLVQTCKDVRDGNVTWKMLMCSGHDTTLAGLLNSLGFFDPPVAPPYASLVTLELWKQNNSNNDYFVNFAYRNDSTREPYHLVLKGCEKNCPLDQFDALTKKLRPENWDNECKAKAGQFNGGDSDSVTVENVYEDTLARNITRGSLFVLSFLAILLFVAACRKFFAAKKLKKVDNFDEYVRVEMNEER